MKSFGIVIVALIAGTVSRSAAAQTCEEQLGKARELIRVGEEERKNAAELASDCARVKALNADLIAKNAELEKLREAKEAELTKSLERAQQSEAELKTAVADLEKKLTDDCAAPWYSGWELWVGAAAGLAAGFAVGWVAGGL